MQTILRDQRIPDCLGAHENYSVLTDQADEAEIRLREAEYADKRTRDIRKAIAGLGRNLTELEVMAIVSSLIGAIEHCGWSHTQEAATAMEYLLDAHTVLEQANG